MVCEGQSARVCLALCRQHWVHAQLREWRIRFYIPWCLFYNTGLMWLKKKKIFPIISGLWSYKNPPSLPVSSICWASGPLGHIAKQWIPCILRTLFPALSQGHSSCRQQVRHCSPEFLMMGSWDQDFLRNCSLLPAPNTHTHTHNIGVGLLNWTRCFEQHLIDFFVPFFPSREN